MDASTFSPPYHHLLRYRSRIPLPAGMPWTTPYIRTTGQRPGHRWFPTGRKHRTSPLIAQGVNVAFASRQLGHASVSTTLNVYTHLFDHAEHAATVIERLEARFAEMLQPTSPDLPAGRQVIEIGRCAPGA